VAEHAELSLIKLLASHMPHIDNVTLSVVQEDCENLIAHADAAGLIQRVLLGDFPALEVLTKTNGGSKQSGNDGNDDEASGGAGSGFAESDAISAFCLLVALLDYHSNSNSNSSNSNSNDELKRQIATKIMQLNSGNVRIRVGMLRVLFNLATVAAEKCALFINMVQLVTATSTSDVDVLVDFCKTRYNGEGLLSSVHLKRLAATLGDVDGSADTVLKRELFQVSGAALAKAGSAYDSERQKVLLLQIATYDEASVDQQALQAAKQAAVGAIRDPITLFTEQRSMLKLPAIAALGKGSPLLYSLLTIFTEGKLEDYKGFCSKNGDALFKEHGLSAEECTRNMRLLSLCSLASEKQEIPYSEIASALAVEKTEVENWVISAKGSGLMDAKMDQIREIIVVERCVVRKFGMEQWVSLQTKLNLWKTNVRAVLDGLKESQAQAQQQIGAM